VKSALQKLDDAGHIAYSLWTKIPKRDASGPFPPWFVMPADQGPHWQGFIPHEMIPFSIDPPEGYVRTSNNDPVGNTLDNNPGNDPFYYGFAYALGYRAQRLGDLLSQLTTRGQITMQELETVQQDRHSLFAEQIIPFFAKAATRRSDLVAKWNLQPYIDAVTNWNRQADADSFEATLFYPWSMQFVADMYLDESDLVYNIGGGTMQLLGPSLIYWLKKTDPVIDGIDAGIVQFPSKSGRNLFDDLSTAGKIETRDELIITALKKAVDHLKNSFTNGLNGTPVSDPTDFTTWKWKNILYLRSRHTLAKLDKSFESYDQFWGTGGNFDTPNVGSFTAVNSDGKLNDQFILGNAPSNRYLWEMRPDGVHGEFMIPTGASEIPGDPHYEDLVDDYIDGNYRDFPYTEDEIAAVKESEKTLSATP